MNCRDIQRRIMVDLYRRAFVLPNFTPRDWWECDVFELTGAGYMREYEIKMTRADYKADALKRRHVSRWLPVEQQEFLAKTKHELLRAGDVRGPRQFWFVSPSGVITNVPAWAGLIHCESRGGRPPWNIRLTEIKRAPHLHRQKIDQTLRDKIRVAAYYRFQHLFCFGREAPVIQIDE